MRIISVVLCVLLGLLPISWAQDHPASAEEIVSSMQSKLSLTPDQVSAVTPIVDKYFSKHQELRQEMEDGTRDPGSLHAQMKLLREDEGHELSQVLSVQQLNQWKQMQRKTPKPK